MNLGGDWIPADRGDVTGKGSTNRGNVGTKCHMVVDRNGLPLAVTISGVNVHDSKRLEEAVDAIPPLRLAGKRRGRPRKRPVVVAVAPLGAL